ncbi:two-component system chemotaxis response regulator CheB [Streptomyces sp. PsTaAH-137]|nr:chemotaxis protein CheB [Streptomyces sp. PsTaAH-137]RAJ90378.1 two-component system chemotaxis response regulator CheB [Streptomyces sp. PsTaAH-137]
MGVEAVKSRGGTVIAQDPETAEFGGMPEAAVGTGAVDFVLPLEEIPAVIRGLVDR